MGTIASLAGELLIDHRDSPGVAPEVMVSHGLPPSWGKGLIEAKSYTCSHCQAQVIMHPERERKREVCFGCNHIICDACAVEKALLGKCVTYKQKVDEILNQNMAALAVKEF